LEGPLLLEDAGCLDDKFEVGEEAVHHVDEGRGDLGAVKDIQELAMVYLIKGFLDVEEGNVKRVGLGGFVGPGVVPQC